VSPDELCIEERMEGPNMTCDSTSETRHLVPQALLEGGGASFPVLVAAVQRRLTDLETGEVLEIVSLEPSTRTDVRVWCDASGHQLLRMLEDGEATQFWIRKR
jgi:tRNA 2-thiouridine synthesizing protein A